MYGTAGQRALLPHTVCQGRADCQAWQPARASALTLHVMADESSFPREALEDQARRLLESARRQSGASVEEMVRLLGELQPRGALTRRSWYDWQNRPGTISLLTGLAAIQMLGPEATIELLFKGSALQQTGAAEADEDNGLESLQRALGTLVAEMADMRDRVEGIVVSELEAQGALMLQILADMRDAGIATSANAPHQLPGEREEPT